MLTLVIGGAASGKSEYAESAVLELPGHRIYLATMQAYDDEGRARVEKHRRNRADKGFETVEQSVNLEEAIPRIPAGSNVLLEDLTNLVANERYRPEKFAPAEAAGLPRDEQGEPSVHSDTAGIGGNEENLDAPDEVPVQPSLTPDVFRGKTDEERILGALRQLADHCGHLTIVTGEVFSGGDSYDEETLAYMRTLARLNIALAREADRVAEIVCGYPNILKEPFFCDKVWL